MHTDLQLPQEVEPGCGLHLLGVKVKGEDEHCDHHRGHDLQRNLGVHHTAGEMPHENKDIRQGLRHKQAASLTFGAVTVLFNRRQSCDETVSPCPIHVLAVRGDREDCQW